MIAVVALVAGIAGGWLVVAALVGIAIGRAIHLADRRDRTAVAS